MKNQLLTTFTWQNKSLQIKYIETMNVTEGVTCDVYEFVGDKSKDLGIIHIKAGAKTPLQRVLHGDATIEGYISGKGLLRVTKLDNSEEIIEVSEEISPDMKYTVQIGEIMQWQADSDSDLTAYEICYPPYSDGRYEEIVTRNS